MRLPLAGVLDFKATRDFRHLTLAEQVHDETADLGSDNLPPEVREHPAPTPGSVSWQRQ